MRDRRESESDGAAASDGASGAAPGKRALTDRLQLKRAEAPTASSGSPPPMPADVGIDHGTPFVDSLLAPIQRHAEPGAADGGGVHQAAALGVSGAGGAMPHVDSIQRSFGQHDVSGIVAHTDGPAAAGSQAMGASAFATGNHVAFGDGAPSLHTAAHEAAHVVQQRGGVQLKGGVGETGDPYERHADAVADAVVQGRSAEALLDQHAGSGGASGAVQRKDPDGGASPFVEGTFLGWPIIIVPDDYRGPHPKTNWIFKKYKKKFEALYEQIASGAGRIKITETGPDGTVYAGFEEKILKAIKRLMTVVPGRKLMQNLEDGAFDVTIQPDPTVRASANSTRRTGTAGDALRNADGTAGAGTSSTISMDPNQSNKTQKAFDKDGNEISFPLFINLGHEMIHAMHNQAGENERNNAATDADYPNREEEAAIAGPGLSENSLRHSFGLTARHGHGINTTADTTATVSGGVTGG